MSAAVRVTTSSGNVFADLGLPDPEERLAKAELVRGIRKIVTARGLTQREVGGLFGIAQPDVSDLFRGKLARFSRERIERFLVALDMDIEIRVTPRAPRTKRAGWSVRFAGG
jgi:predicted XRE-type DNA-binding protein